MAVIPILLIYYQSFSDTILSQWSSAGFFRKKPNNYANKLGQLSNKMYLCGFAKSNRKYNNNYNFMKLINSMNLVGKNYENPTVTVLDVQAEGVLCGRGDFDAPDWGEGNNNWFE